MIIKGNSNHYPLSIDMSCFYQENLSTGEIQWFVFVYVCVCSAVFHSDILKKTSSRIIQDRFNPSSNFLGVQHGIILPRGLWRFVTSYRAISLAFSYLFLLMGSRHNQGILRIPKILYPIVWSRNQGMHYSDKPISVHSFFLKSFVFKSFDRVMMQGAPRSTFVVLIFLSVSSGEWKKWAQPISLTPLHLMLLMLLKDYNVLLSFLIIGLTKYKSRSFHW